MLLIEELVWSVPHDLDQAPKEYLSCFSKISLGIPEKGVNLPPDLQTNILACKHINRLGGSQAQDISFTIFNSKG